MFDPSVNPYTGQPIFSAFSPVLPMEPVIPDGEAVYNDIMGKIEPELTTAMMPMLDSTYTNESPEQHTARQKRYKLALEEYQKQLATYLTAMQSQMSQFERGMREAMELAEVQAESRHLESITSAISNFS